MKNSNLCKVSIVIPVYGSQDVLSELVSQIISVLSNLEGIKKSFEIILVCDQSPDASWGKIKLLSQLHPEIKGLLLRVNTGQHNACMAGFAYSSGDIIVTMDDDLQHSPSYIPMLINVIELGSDVVYARFRDRKHPGWKILGSYFNDWAARFLVSKPKDLYLSSFRAFTSAIRDEILRYQGPFVYIDGLILNVTRNISSVDVEHHDRFAGKSFYGFRKSVSLWMKMATGFSIAPLRFTSFMGLFFSGLGFLLAIIFVIQKFTLNMMPIGWSSLIVTLLIVSGVQLLALGLIGEYIGRLFLTINLRPQYIIAEKVGLNPYELNSSPRL